MQTATLIVSCLSLAVSTTTLVVFVIVARNASTAILDFKVEAQQKIEGLKRAVADL